MSLNNVKPSGDDAEWKHQVEVELLKNSDNIDFMLGELRNILARLNQ